MNPPYKFNRLEFAGSLGDLGTLFPLGIGMIMINGLNPGGVFFAVGIFYIFSGLYYGITVPVQPMKVIGAYAIAMETTTLFTVGFHNKIPTGALLLVTDQPMVPEGVKTMEKDAVNSKLFDQRHVEIGIASLKQLINNGETIRHLVF